MKQLTPGTYKHFKSKFYKVIGVCHHSETLEAMVIYQALYDSPEFGHHPVFVRPLDMFMENVEIDGKVVQRFEFVKK